MGEQETPVTTPSCFGDLERVFPRSKQGLREVQEQCWNCGQRVECLRAAVSGSRPSQLQAGGQPQTPEEPSVLEGVGGFLERWSRRKSESKTERKKGKS